MFGRILLTLALVFVVSASADAKKNQYPKAGVNCGLKNANCIEKCNSNYVNVFDVKAVQGRNECLNNCTIAYDVCLGAPALQGATEDGQVTTPNGTLTAP